jgi:hypothetical protein
VLKVQHKPIKRSKLEFKRKEQKKPERNLVWRTGLSGVPPDSVRAPPDSVRCPGPHDFKLATFGFLESRSAIIHWTVRCASGAMAGERNGHLQREQCADSSRRVKAAPEGAPDSEQDMSGAALECSVHQDVRAPTVETIRTLMVG